MRGTYGKLQRIDCTNSNTYQDKINELQERLGTSSIYLKKKKYYDSKNDEKFPSGQKAICFDEI